MALYYNFAFAAKEEQPIWMVKLLVEGMKQQLRSLYPGGRGYPREQAESKAFTCLWNNLGFRAPIRVVVDFSRLEFISSAGMRVLLIAAKALKATVWPGKEDGGQPPLPWLLESCQVHSSHEGKMTTVQKEKMARRKLSLLRLAQELGKRVAAQGNPGELDGRVGSCFGNRRTRERVRIYRQSLALTVWTLCCPLRRGA